MMPNDHSDPINSPWAGLVMRRGESTKKVVSPEKHNTDDVWYHDHVDGRGWVYLRSCSRKQWHIWAKGAEVISRGDE